MRHLDVEGRLEPDVHARGALPHGEAHARLRRDVRAALHRHVHGELGQLETELEDVVGRRRGGGGPGEGLGDRGEGWGGWGEVSRGERCRVMRGGVAWDEAGVAK